MAARIRQRLDGMCVNTIVLTRPMRRDSHAATGNEKAESTPDQKKNRPAGRQRQPELAEQPQRDQRLHGKSAGKGIDAEQRREFVDDAARRAEGGYGLHPLRRRRHAGNVRIDAAAHDPEHGIEDEHGLQAPSTRSIPIVGQDIGAGGGKRADRGGQRADQAVARKHPGALRIGDRARQHAHARAARRC